MNQLPTLWSISLLLSGAALATMLGLLLGRMLSGWLQEKREGARRALVPMLLGAAPPGAVGMLGRGKLLTDISVELIRLVRGSDRENFVQTATRFGVPARLRHRLGSGSPRVRLSAAEALGEFGDEQSIASLRAALRDANAEVRLGAALALSTIGRTPPAAELIALLGIGTTETSLLVNGLFREIARHRLDEVKSLVLADDIPSGARLAAIQALASSGDYSLVPVVAELAAAAATNDPALPAYLEALGKFAHPAARDAVRGHLSSSAQDVRAAAAEAAGQIGLIELAPALAELLGDEVFWVRFRAGEALVRLGEDGIAFLRRAGASTAEPARTAAAVTMAERGVQ